MLETGWTPIIWHLAFYGKKLLIKNTDMTIKALYENDLKILTHPGDKGRFDIAAIAKACAETGTLMEISTWHAHLTTEEIKISAKTEAEFIVSSDAHTPDRVGSFMGGVDRALEAGLDVSRIVNIEEILVSMEKMKVVIVTGLSGAGKTNAADWFEDQGYYCVDNMPPALIRNFIDLTVYSNKKN